MIYQQQTLNCRGTVLSIDRPLVMGVLNVTPDSFYDGGAFETTETAVAHVGRMLNEGASVIDIGASSSRPGAIPVSREEELQRLMPVLELIRKNFPEAILSVDTMYASVARAVLEAGAHVINDISGGTADLEVMQVCAEYDAPFILMHMLGTPETMQLKPSYKDVTEEVLKFFVQQLRALRSAGVKDVLIDPGFGFGKDLEHNYQLLDKLGVFKFLELPIVAGLSRKSMICKVLGVSPGHALNGTTALHMLALEKGARLLRVHDVKEAVETIRLFEYYRGSKMLQDQPQSL